MSPTMERVNGWTELKDIFHTRQFGGILIVTKEHRDAFEESYNECLEKDKDPLSKLSLEDLDIIHQLRVTAHAKVAYRMFGQTDFTVSQLKENDISYWEEKDPLPAFVVAKVNQLEAKRRWSHWSPEEIAVYQQLFSSSVPFDEFVTVEQSVPSYPNAPAVYNRFSTEGDEPGEFETNGRLMLQAAGDWAKETSEGVIVPQLRNGRPGSWPDHMGILTLQPSSSDEQIHKLSFILAYRLKYKGGPDFDLTIPHSKAHFQLRLLNMLDARMRPLSREHDRKMEDVYNKLATWWNVDDDHQNKRTKYSSTHDVHVFTNWKELDVYKTLLQFNSRDYPDIKHFNCIWFTGCWNGYPFLDLPYYHPVGDELRKKQGGLLHGQSLLLCDQLLTAVNFLHSIANIAHMDIKPDNLVFLDEDGVTLKVIDFNVSIVRPPVMSHLVHEGPGAIWPLRLKDSSGTLQYLQIYTHAVSVWVTS
ncbi:hypothetical protein BT96DRAFT_984156 [Gymnopus androsaceus JB14]|uniref:Protein kinase domain-containing protein n=1 Tax=Gymnopus androsaceus JB14 TaxID=1447944 RepID=A0A6A4IGT7_9AGAR|nr:hypothetical protein BT96DRAFT_984156 [Gymnopus androsaceus JB14]